MALQSRPDAPLQPAHASDPPTTIAAATATAAVAVSPACHAHLENPVLVVTTALQPDRNHVPADADNDNDNDQPASDAPLNQPPLTRALSVPPPRGISIRWLPFIGRIITVSAPPSVRAFAAHPLIGRPDSAPLPFPARTLLMRRSTFAAVYTSSSPSHTARLSRTHRNLAAGFTPAQLHALHAVVRSGLGLHDAAPIVASVVGPRLIGLPPGVRLPRRVLRWLALGDLRAIRTPLDYLRVHRARRKLQDWCHQRVPGAERADVAHDLTVVYHGLTAGLLRLRDMRRGVDVEAEMARNPVLPASLRVCGGKGVVGGVNVCKGDVVLLRNGSAAMEAAAEAHPGGGKEFVFGMGAGGRVCPFRGLFLDTADELLRRGCAADEVVGSESLNEHEVQERRDMQTASALPCPPLTSPLPPIS